MRKSVAATVRMHKWRLEERARVVDELERLREKLINAAQQLDAELAEASRGRAVNSGYAQAVGLRRERLQQSLAGVEGQMDQARKDAAEAFEELKKYEAALAQRERMRQKRGGRGHEPRVDAPAPTPEPQRRVG
jgi:hypothetical protein